VERRAKISVEVRFNADDTISGRARVVGIVEDDDLARQATVGRQPRQGGDDVGLVINRRDWPFPTVALGLDAPAETLELLCANERKREQLAFLDLRMNEAPGKGKVTGTPC